MEERRYFVYIVSNRSGTLHTGVTNDLRRRVYQHKHGLTGGVTKRYNVDRLLCFERTTDIRSAVAREKEIKGWLRSKKIVLIESKNRDWKDLAADWFRNEPAPAH